MFCLLFVWSQCWTLCPYYMLTWELVHQSLKAPIFSKEGGTLEDFFPEINKRTYIYIRYDLIISTNQCRTFILEPVCCKKRGKNPNHGTASGNRRPLDALINTKLVLNDVYLGPIWYHSIITLTSLLYGFFFCHF